MKIAGFIIVLGLVLALLSPIIILVLAIYFVYELALALINRQSNKKIKSIEGWQTY